MSDDEVLIENKDFRYLLPKVIIDSETFSCLSDNLYLNSVKFQDASKQYYYAYNKLYASYPLSTPLLNDNAGEMLFDKYYVIPKNYQLNGITYYVEDLNGSSSWNSKTGNLVTFEYNPDEASVGKLYHFYDMDNNLVYIVPEKITLEIDSETNIYEADLTGLNSTTVVDIQYNVIKQNKIHNRFITRHQSEVINYISTEINNLIKKKNYNKLKYLYYEWFNEKESNINLIIDSLKDILNKDFSSKHISFFELLKLSNMKKQP